MAVFGSFVYGSGVTYGTSINITDLDFLNRNLLLIKLSDAVVVDSNYKDPNNYSVILSGGSGSLNVRRVLETNDIVTDSVILVIDTITIGSVYTVTALNLSGRSGVVASGSADVEARYTKGQSILRSLPNHFDKRPESTIASLLLSLGRQDDIIGGSREDSIDFDTVVISGSFLSPTLNVTAPADLATVSSPFTVTGTFSDADRIEILIDGVSQGNATLNSPTPGDFELTITASPATYTLKTIAIGQGFTTDTRTITVT